MSDVSQASKVTLCVQNSKVAAVPEGYKPVPEGYKPVPEGYKHTRSRIELPGQLKTCMVFFSEFSYFHLLAHCAPPLPGPLMNEVLFHRI